MDDGANDELVSVMDNTTQDATMTWKHIWTKCV